MDASFRPDAPPELALAREQRLNNYRNLVYRGRRLPTADHPQDLPTAIEWVEQLAAAGHVSARRLLRKAIERAHVVHELWHKAPDLLARISPDRESTAALVAWSSLFTDPVDLQATERLMQQAGPSVRVLGEHLAVFREAGGRLHEQDVHMLQGLVPYCRRDDARKLNFERSKNVLRDLAKWRLRSMDAEERRLGGVLMLKAAQRGDETAWPLCWTHELTVERERNGGQALDFPQLFALTQQWFAQGRPPVREAGAICMLLAVAREAGRGGQPKDFGQALVWWERAFCGSPKLEADGTPGPVFRGQVVAWLKTVAERSPVIGEVLGAWEVRLGGGEAADAGREGRG